MMKKTIKNKDGTTEVIEGTSEEIAAYENSKKKGSEQKSDPLKEGTPKTPGLLTDELVRKMKESFIPSFKYVPPIHAEHCELVVASRGWMSIIPPKCSCGADPYFRQPVTYTITCQSTDNTSNKISLVDQWRELTSTLVNC